MIINIVPCVPHVFLKKQSREIWIFSPNGFRSIWLYVCHFLACFLFYNETSSFCVYNFPCIQISWTFFTCNFLEDAWLTRYDIIVLTLFFVHSLCILNSLLKSWSCLLFLFIDHFLPFCFIHAWFSQKGKSCFTHDTDMKYLKKVF